MPKVSTSGQDVTVVHIDSDYTFGPSDTIASLKGLPTSGLITVFLPGPNTTPDDLPRDGDFYVVADPGGFTSGLGPGQGVAVDGGGNNVFGAPVFGPIDIPGFGLKFRFDDVVHAWFLEAFG